MKFQKKKEKNYLTFTGRPHFLTASLKRIKTVEALLFVLRPRKVVTLDAPSTQP